MNASAAAKNPTSSPIVLTKADPGRTVFAVDSATGISLKPGTIVAMEGFTWAYAGPTPLILPSDLIVGADYAVFINTDGLPEARHANEFGALIGAIGGFHYAPGGNAVARAGGDNIPAINAFSCWDSNFRPACPDPRGMTFVDGFWADIYILNRSPNVNGTSVFGLSVADGDEKLPLLATGIGAAKLDFATAVKIYSDVGKQLMTYDEFRAAAFGVTEKTSADDAPALTGLDAGRTSKFGLMQATGNLWVWGTDGDPDSPRPSIFGGSWFSGSDAGSRYAGLGYWADYSSGYLSARGRSDHLQPA